jgi:UDP-glucose 4-epimerase
MKILVTGGAGFIASHIVDKLIQKKHEVVIIDNLSTGKIQNINPKAKFYNENIVNKLQIKEIFKIERPEILIHHAAQIDVQKSINNPSEDALINIIGTINLLECCRDYGVNKIIYASSAAEYGEHNELPITVNHAVNPISFYGISKHTPIHYIQVFSQLYNIKYTILRYANVYGIRQDSKGEGGVISLFIDKYLKGETPIIYGDGEQTRDFIYVEDVAEANINAINIMNNGVFNVSINKSISVNELIVIFNRISYKDMKPIYKEERKGDIKHSRLDNSITIEKLCWKPSFEIEEGLSITYNHYLCKTLYTG